MNYCPNCGSVNKRGSHFCSNCSARLVAPSEVHCPICGAANSPDAAICGNCRAQLKRGVGGRVATASGPAATPGEGTGTDEGTRPQPLHVPAWVARLRAEHEAAPRYSLTRPPRQEELDERGSAGRGVSGPSRGGDRLSNLRAVMAEETAVAQARRGKVIESFPIPKWFENIRPPSTLGLKDPPRIEWGPRLLKEHEARPDWLVELETLSPEEPIGTVPVFVVAPEARAQRKEAERQLLHEFPPAEESATHPSDELTAIQFTEVARPAVIAQAAPEPTISAPLSASPEAPGAEPSIVEPPETARLFASDIAMQRKRALQADLERPAPKREAAAEVSPAPGEQCLTQDDNGPATQPHSRLAEFDAVYDSYGAKGDEPLQVRMPMLVARSAATVMAAAWHGPLWHKARLVAGASSWIAVQPPETSRAEISSADGKSEQQKYRQAGLVVELGVYVAEFEEFMAQSPDLNLVTTRQEQVPPAEKESPTKAPPERMEKVGPPPVEGPAANFKAAVNVPPAAEPAPQSATEEPPNEAPAQTAATENGVPDWLRELNESQAVDTAQGPVKDTPPDRLTTAALEPGQVPEWMQDLSVPPAPVEAPPEGLVWDSETLPEQLSREEVRPEELPDWLRAPDSAEAAAEEDAEADNLATSKDYPGWWDALSPSPTIPVPQDPLPDVTEANGPLEGIRGVLPIAFAVSESHPAPPAAQSPEEGGRVFRGVLAAPADRPAVKPAKAKRRFWFLRWFNLLILLAALVPLFMPGDWAGLGLNVANPVTAAFYDKLQAVGAGSTVLLAFDYDMGQAVELNPAARVLVRDLAQRGINVLALSTSPVGAQIAETVLREAASGVRWESGSNFVNLGYIPGEEAGLRALADRWMPAEQVGFDNRPLSSAPLVARVSGWRDFALVIELAGGEDSLRWWMQQVQPSRQATFVAVVSAAVEPSARNYLASNQLAAFLRGVTGAAEYELSMNRAGPAVRMADALSFSTLALVGIILVGNVAMLFQGRRP